jgi:ketosteroid isomerase-like protein
MKKGALAYLAAAASVSYLLGAQNVAAASTDELRAKAYFNAIVGGNAETIASFYAEKAEFHWVGGPLAGIYKGKEQIKDVWQKFSKAAGDMKHQVLEISESKNGKISTVTARVKFIGPKEVPVKFILMYENGKITNEIWQVDKPETYATVEPAPASQTAKATAAPEPAEQPADTASPPADQTAAEKPREVIVAITTSPPASGPAATSTESQQDQASTATPPTPEKRTADYLPPEKKAADPAAPGKKAADTAPRKKVANVKKPDRKSIDGRDYYDEDEEDDYEDYRPRRYYYGYQPYYRPYYGYGGYYGFGYRLGYGYRYGRY